MDWAWTDKRISTRTGYVRLSDNLDTPPLRRRMIENAFRYREDCVMGWSVEGELVESCSCNMLCPCWYGVKELMIMDQGWCASPWLIRIQEGESNGVDISGMNVVLVMFFPGPTLLDGNGTGRLHIDERANDEQRRELEAIFTAKRGGPLEVPGALLSKWLPTIFSKIEFTEANGSLMAKVGEHGVIVSKRLVNEQGDSMTMQNVAFALALLFKNKTAELAPTDGSSWNDPELPHTWKGRSGAVGQIAWSVS